ncbi:MAG: hypothetical protein ACR2K1_03085 [Saprospiraceae bacterium]
MVLGLMFFFDMETAGLRTRNGAWNDEPAFGRVKIIFFHDLLVSPERQMYLPIACNLDIPARQGMLLFFIANFATPNRVLFLSAKFQIYVEKF